MQKAKILIADSEDCLCCLIEEYLDLGWDCQGGVAFHSHLETGSGIIVAAKWSILMVKKEKKSG